MDNVILWIALLSMGGLVVVSALVVYFLHLIYEDNTHDH